MQFLRPEVGFRLAPYQAPEFRLTPLKPLEIPTENPVNSDYSDYSDWIPWGG